MSARLSFIERHPAQAWLAFALLFVAVYDLTGDCINRGR
jgi:hypothetical protein